MTSVQWIPALMFTTLAFAAAFGVIQLFKFMQRSSNRQAAENALAGGRSVSDHGALPEIAGVGVIALVAIALLTVGYNNRGDGKQTAGVPTPATTGASATDRMTDQARPRANPAEMSQPPTQYPLGSGSPDTAPTNGPAADPAKTK